MDLTGHRAGPGRAIEWAKSWPSLLRAGPRPNNGVAMLHFQNATVAHHCHVDAQQGTWLKVVAHGPGPWARSGPGLPGHPYKSCAMSRLWRGRALNRVAHRFKPLTSHGPHCRVPGQKWPRSYISGHTAGRTLEMVPVCSKFKMLSSAIDAKAWPSV